MAWQEVKSFIIEPRQFIRDYQDRKRIIDPLLKERIKVFDLGAGRYNWPIRVVDLSSKGDLFQSDDITLRSIFRQVVSSRVAHPEPSDTIPNSKQLGQIW